MSNKSKATYLLVPLSLGWALASTPLHAQATEGSETPASDQFSEIIVTAQKRAQSINDVGMSINAISGDTLEGQRLISTADLTRVVPGFSVAGSVSGAPVYTLRGIGFNARNLSALSAVSVYLDEVPLSYTYMTGGPLVDVERVEVLKGPQGTLYGQNSTGGAINYIANKPTDSFEGGAELTYGRFDLIDASAYLSGPLSDTLGARVAMRGIRSDGWQKSITRDDDFGGTKSFSGRFILEWEPSDSARFQFNANGWKDRSDNIAFQIVGINPADRACFDGTPPGCLLLGGAQYPLYDEVLDFPRRGDSLRAADRDADVDYRNDSNFYQLSLRGDIDLSPDVTLTSISSYSRFKLGTARDLDGTPYRISNFFGKGRIKAVNQELRFSGQAGDTLNWIVGGNYSDDRIRERVDNPAGGTSIGQSYGLDNAVTVSRLHRSSWAVFANADYEIAPQLTLTAGGRYTEVKMNFTGCTKDPGDGSLLIAFAGTAGPGECVTYLDVTSVPPNQGEVTQRVKEHSVSWRGGLNWQPGEDILLYANVSRGFKSGDIPAITALVESQLQPVKQEKVTAYEAGAKLRLLGGAVQLNGAVFHYDFVNKQLQTSIQTFLGLAEATQNIPKSKVDGAELELIVRPMEGLMLNTGIGYTHTKIGTFSTFTANTSPIWPPAPENEPFFPAVFKDVSGQPFNLSPEWQVNANAQYDWQLSSDLGMFVGVSGTHSSSTPSAVGASELLRLEAYTLIDVRAGITGPDDQWNVMIFGRNITNEHYSISALPAFDVSGLFPGMAMTWGITVGTRFQ